MIVSLSPAVRVTPPSEVSGDLWAADDLLRRKRFLLSPHAAAALVAAARPQEERELAEALAASRAHPRPAGHWLGVIAALRERGLVLDQQTVDRDPGLDWLKDVRARWSAHGWHESAEYHLLSFDYPCVDYAEGAGFLADRSRMLAYQADEPDRDRCKPDYLDRPELPLPLPTEDLIGTPAQQVWGGSTAPGEVDAQAVRTTVSAALGITGFITPSTDSARRLRRSSPSGGARHPTEGYLLALDVAGMEPAWYHVTMEPFGLRRLDAPVPDGAALSRLFPDTAQNFPFRLRAAVVLTSVFERNMYRYREARTYRTVHMDAGHVAGTVCIAARSLGLTSKVFFRDAATGIEDALGLDGMAEGHMLTVALADGTDGDGDASPRPSRPNSAGSTH